MDPTSYLLILDDGTEIPLRWVYFQSGYTNLLFGGIPSEDIHQFGFIASSIEKSKKLIVKKKDEIEQAKVYELKSISTIAYTPISKEYNFTLAVEKGTL